MTLTLVNAPAYRRLVPQEPQSFSDEADRSRLTSVALRAYRALADKWRLTGNEAASLLAVSPSTWDRLKKTDTPAPFNQDTLTRISALIGTMKALRLLFADEFADAWPKLPNKGALFEGLSPVEAMIKGGIPRMLEVRRHVDALRGGM